MPDRWGDHELYLDRKGVPLPLISSGADLECQLGGGGGAYSYSGFDRLISFEIRLISIKISRAGPEYMNIHHHPPINALDPSLHTLLSWNFDLAWI